MVESEQLMVDPKESTVEVESMDFAVEPPQMTEQKKKWESAPADSMKWRSDPQPTVDQKKLMGEAKQ